MIVRNLFQDCLCRDTYFKIFDELSLINLLLITRTSKFFYSRIHELINVFYDHPKNLDNKDFWQIKKLINQDNISIMISSYQNRPVLLKSILYVHSVTAPLFKKILVPFFPTIPDKCFEEFLSSFVQAQALQRYKLAFLKHCCDEKAKSIVAQAFVSLENQVQSHQNQWMKALQFNLDLMQNKNISLIEMLDEMIHSQVPSAKSSGLFYKSLVLLTGIDGVAQNREEGTKALLESAGKGNVLAQVTLGYGHAWGLYGRIKDEKLEFHWINQAAKQGHPYAQFRLGVFYYHGMGVIKCHLKAFDWIEKAAQQGYLIAQRNLADFYHKGYGVSQNSKMAAYWFEKAVNQGDSLSQNQLGELFLNNVKIQDFKKAFYWHQKAANQGSADSQNALGYMLLEGKGVEQDYVSAVMWFRKSADQGQKEAQCNLAHMYAHGLGVDQDVEKALNLYLKIANDGVVIAQNNLGALYLELKEYEQAYYWLEKAASQGFSKAFESLGYLLIWHRDPPDYQNGLLWLAKAAERGQMLAQVCLGGLYLLGQGVAEDLTKAVEWLQKAADQGSAISAKALAKLFEEGKCVERDLAKSVHYYRKAAEGGLSEVYTTLAFSLLYGRGVNADEEEAIFWYEKAAKKQDVRVQICLGMLYRRKGNSGNPECLKIADSWIAKAAANPELTEIYQNAEKDEFSACYMGFIYEYGIGVPVDDSLAQTWYENAVRLGHPTAEQHLHSILHNS